MPAKKKSPLMTPDPYHTPGYCGFVPQFKYDVGETFGLRTHRLLTSTDPKVASSGNSVLCDIYPGPSSLPAETNQEFSSSPIYTNTTRSWGDQKYKAHMVPGYAGYIPKGWQHFGNRYAETCHKAMSSFEADQHTHRTKMDDMRQLTRMPSGGNHGPNTPLKPIRAKADPFFLPPTHLRSPHHPTDSGPSKFQISGYMGFVPKIQRYIGQGYPILSSYALREHDRETERIDQTYREPVMVVRQPERPMVTLELYPKRTGLVPRYMGHIPGQQFRFGGTFGTITRDAKHVMSTAD